MNEDELIVAMRDHLQGPAVLKEARAARNPVTAEEMLLFESHIPYPLPQLFRRVYMDIGDGGWGPWNGLCPLGIRGDENEPHFSVLGQWKANFSPQQDGVSADSLPLLYFCDGGCTIFSVLDLKSERIGLRDDDIEWQAESLHEWLERWLNGEQLMASGKTQ